MPAAPTRAGYTFAGWNDGAATYGAGATYTLSSDGAAIVFTAQWTANASGTITQTAPFGQTVTAPNTGSSFSDQLAVSGSSGGTTYAVTTSNLHLSVSASGQITTVGGPLAVGTYTVKGTDKDSNGHVGIWSYTLTVTAPTTTTLSKSHSSVTYGDEGDETLTATVTTGTDNTVPTGTVTFVSGSTTLCVTSNFAHDGPRTYQASCSLTNTQLAVGSYGSVTAVYSGNSHYLSSSSSPAQTFSVTKDSTTTKVSESPTSVFYGNESAAVFTVTVTTGNGERVPNGETVTVKVGSGSVTCTVTLSSGTGTCTLNSNTALALGGPYTVSASYAGDANLTSSSRTANTGLSVDTATSTGLTLSSSSVTYGHEGAQIFTVHVTAASGTPTGTVSVTSTAGTLCTITLEGGTGHCSLGATAIAASGTAHAITATYNPSGTFAGSTSSPQSLLVNQDSTTTKVTESRTSVAHGSESAVVFTVTVSTGNGETVPNGETAKVHVGSVTCTVTLHGGIGTCTITNSALSIGGPYAVSASYSGDGNLTDSSGTSSSGLTVTSH